MWKIDNGNPWHIFTVTSFANHYRQTCFIHDILKQHNDSAFNYSTLCYLTTESRYFISVYIVAIGPVISGLSDKIDL